MLLHDNATFHESNTVQIAIVESGFQEQIHPLYSPYFTQRPIVTMFCSPEETFA